MENVEPQKATQKETAKTDKPQIPLASRLGTIGAIIGGCFCNFVLGPILFPRQPGQGFSFEQMGLAAAGGAGGAAIGMLFGYLIDKTSKKAK